MAEFTMESEKARLAADNAAAAAAVALAQAQEAAAHKSASIASFTAGIAALKALDPQTDVIVKDIAELEALLAAAEA